MEVQSFFPIFCSQGRNGHFSSEFLVICTEESSRSIGESQRNLKSETKSMSKFILYFRDVLPRPSVYFNVEIVPHATRSLSLLTYHISAYINNRNHSSQGLLSSVIDQNNLICQEHYNFIICTTLLPLKCNKL